MVTGGDKMNILQRIRTNNKLRNIIIGIIVLIILVILFIVTFYYNPLSKNETVDKFLTLINYSEYNEAKKYISSDLKTDLSTIRKDNLLGLTSFSVSYKNYKLGHNRVAYIIDDGGFGKMVIAIFECKKTILGWKIVNYDPLEIVEY